jgi:hypothetical protein
LFVRAQYRDSIFPRILVTLGALCMLAIYLVPVNDKMGLIACFDILADGEGTEKVAGILLLLPFIYTLMSLLVWLPASSSGLGSVTAWLWITFLPLVLIIVLILAGHIGDVVKHSPYRALMSWAPSTAYFVLIGYGFATVFGKQLE